MLKLNAIWHKYRRIDPALSCQAHISKGIPQGMAVTLDVRVYASQTPGRMVHSEGQRVF